MYKRQILQRVSSGLRGNEVGKQIPLYSVEVAVSVLVSGSCPVSVTLLVLFVRSVNSCTLMPGSRGYQVVLNVTG